VKVTLTHLRSVPGFGPKPGFCAGGARAFFARYGLDWSTFIKDGIDEEALLGTGDALAIALVEHARRCEQ